MIEIVDAVLRHAATSPNRDAVIDADHGTRRTFAELAARVEHLAGALSAVLSVAPGDRIAILSKNSVEYIELYLAVPAAGAVVVPLNWRTATAEVGDVLQATKPAVVFFSSEFRESAGELQARLDGITWVEIGSLSGCPFEELIARRKPRSAVRAVGPQDPVVMLSTGGTSGKSKIVVHTRQSLAACMLNESIADRIAPSDVYLLTGQLFHIPVVKAWAYLSHGRPVVLMNFDVERALNVIEQERVSGFVGITTMLSRMLSVPMFDSFDLGSLRIVQYGGGPMPEAVVRQAMERLPGDLMQAYGQTEGGSMSFLGPEVHRSALAGDRPYRLASCGKPAHLTTVRLVGESGEDVPRDRESVGEIWVKSPANMSQYWCRPELTAETMTAQGWLRTGDLAQWDIDGLIYIAGRSKDMIISGGENIYPAQIERVIQTHCDVRQCAVVGVPDSEWGEKVVAAIVPADEATIGPEFEAEIVELVRSRLGSYMKPKATVLLGEMPTSATGKLQKNTLREIVIPLVDTAPRVPRGSSCSEVGRWDSR